VTLAYQKRQENGPITLFDFHEPSEKSSGYLVKVTKRREVSAGMCDRLRRDYPKQASRRPLSKGFKEGGKQPFKLDCIKATSMKCVSTQEKGEQRLRRPVRAPGSNGRTRGPRREPIRLSPRGQKHD